MCIDRLEYTDYMYISGHWVWDKHRVGLDTGSGHFLYTGSEFILCTGGVLALFVYRGLGTLLYAGVWVLFTDRGLTPLVFSLANLLLFIACYLTNEQIIRHDCVCC